MVKNEITDEEKNEAAESYLRVEIGFGKAMDRYRIPKSTLRENARLDSAQICLLYCKIQNFHTRKSLNLFQSVRCKRYRNDSLEM